VSGVGLGPAGEGQEALPSAAKSANFMVTPMEWLAGPDQPTGPDLDAQRGEERFRGRVEA
jgi:hypothetical protein